MPGSSKSNNNGRSLEYLITRALEGSPECSLTPRACASQSRDSVTVSKIDSRLRASFSRAAPVVASWVLSEIGKTSGIRFVVDRNSDSDVGVADLTIAAGRKSFQISVKHNHDALSHPRPYSLADAMGLTGSHHEIDHRKRMAIATDSFRKSIKGATRFPSVVPQKIALYKDVCNECKKTVDLAAKATDVPSTLFEFLVGSGFKKVIVSTSNSSKALKSIQVVDYSRIRKPTKVRATVDHRKKASSLVLTFDNGWMIDLRIKNASTDISASGQVSLKFDAQKKAGTLPAPVVLL